MLGTCRNYEPRQIRILREASMEPYCDSVRPVLEPGSLKAIGSSGLIASWDRCCNGVQPLRVTSTGIPTTLAKPLEATAPMPVPI